MAEVSDAESTGYDEARIRARLTSVPPELRVAFACAVAERLMPTADWLSLSINRGGPAELRTALDLAWSVAGGSTPAESEVEEARELAESLVPDDEDDDWTELSPLVQNSAAAVAYAVRTCAAGDPQEATWAARQLYEAADYLVQLVEPEQTYRPIEDGVGEPVEMAVRGIHAALDRLGSVGVDQLRAEAAADGVAFVRLLNPDG